jgi:hypothetical protein
VGFKDPWLYDYDGPLEKQNRPYNPIAYYSLGTYSIRMDKPNSGVFLNTDNSLVWNLPTYSVIANKQNFT